MAIIKSRPLTPSQRFLELGRNEVDNKRPERSLTESKQRAKGRNCYGRITSRRRGGGGYIKITRATYDLSTLKMHLINSIGNNIDERSCRAHIVNLHDRGLLEDKEAAVMLAATADKSYHDVPHELRDKLRANIFKQMLISSMK